MELKEIISQILEERKVRERGSEVWYLCPFHNDTQASMHIDYEREIWYCFVCTPTGYEATLKGLYEKLTGQKWKSETEQTLELIEDFDDFIAYCQRRLYEIPSLISYLQTHRGLSLNVIKAAKLGLWERNNEMFLTIPISDGEKFVAIKVRRLERTQNEIVFSSQEPRYFFLTKHHHPVIPDTEIPSLYPLNFPVKNASVLVVVGGELDALATISAGYMAIAPTKGETFFVRPLNIRRHADIFTDKTIILCLDNEPSIQSNITKIAQNFAEISYPVMICPITEYQTFKDATELVVAGIIHTVISNAEPIPLYTSKKVIVYRKDDGYYFKTKGRNKWSEEQPFIKNVIFHPKELVFDIEADKYSDKYGSLNLIVDIHYLNEGLVKRNVVLPASFFGNQSVRNELSSVHNISQYIFVHKLEIFNEFWNYLTRNLTPRYATSILGLNEFNDEWFFVFQDTVIAPSYLQRKPDIRFFMQQSWDIAEVHISPPELDNETVYDLIKRLIEILPKLHAPETITKILAITHAFALTPFIRKKCSKMPVTLIYGYIGSGKTSLSAYVMQPLLGMKPSVRLAIGQTESTVRKYAHTLASLPLVFDEFTPDRHDPTLLQNVKLFIHACYDGTTKQVSRSATALERPYVARSPLVIIGETNTWIVHEPALRERVYQIPFLRPPTNEEKEAFKEYMDMYMAGIVSNYAYLYYKFLIDNNHMWDVWWNDALNISRKFEIEIPRTERIDIMLAVATFGAILMRKFWGSLGVDVEIDYKNIIPFFGALYPSNRVERFLVEINDAAASGLIKEGVHYYYEKGLLFINIVKCLQELKIMNRQYWGAVSSSSLKSDMRNLPLSEEINYIIDVERVCRVRGEWGRWLVIDPHKFTSVTGWFLSDLMAEQPSIPYDNI